MLMTEKPKKILVHTCCAACASHVFFELKKLNFEVTAYFYNPQIHGRSEYDARLKDVADHCEEYGIKLIVPKYNVHDFFEPLLPFQDKRSIKYITDKERYKRKRCQLCINLLMSNTVVQAGKNKIKNISTTMLCSPYKNHEEIWNSGSELAANHKIEFFYKDFRKGYWYGRNYARNHTYLIPGYCGCSESLEEGRLE